MAIKCVQVVTLFSRYFVINYYLASHTTSPHNHRFGFNRNFEENIKSRLFPQYCRIERAQSQWNVQNICEEDTREVVQTKTSAAAVLNIRQREKDEEFVFYSNGIDNGILVERCLRSIVTSERRWGSSLLTTDRRVITSLDLNRFPLGSSRNFVLPH